MRLPTPRQYPKDIRVRDELYKIKFVRKIQGESANTQGLCDPSLHIIYIKQGQTHAETFYTFIHECMHAFEAEYDIGTAHSDVYKLEKAIGDFLLTNF